MQVKQDQKIRETESLYNYYLGALGNIFFRKVANSVLHGKVLTLLRNLGKDKRLRYSEKERILYDISSNLLQRGHYLLLTEAFASINQVLFNTYIKINIAKAHRLLAKNISSEEADNCAVALLSGDKHRLQRNIYEAFELFSDTNAGVISDDALFGMVELYYFIAGKLSAAKYHDGSYQTLLKFALYWLNSISNKQSVDYLLMTANCHYGLGQYTHALEWYTRLLDTNYPDRHGVLMSVDKMLRLIKSQQEYQASTSALISNASGTLFASAQGRGITAEASNASVVDNSQQIQKMLFNASVLEFNGRYEEASSIYKYLMSIKPTMETRQNIQRCDWYVNAHNASSVPLPQQDPEEDSLTYR